MPLSVRGSTSAPASLLASDVQLSVGDIAETVTVSGASPVVDIQNVEQRAVMDREVIDSIPTGKTYQNYGMLVPGMGLSESYLSPITQDQGGMAPITLTALSIHGGSSVDQQVEINGMDVGDPGVQGTQYTLMPDSNFEEVSIQYSGNAADVETGGVRVNTIPREGSNEFSGMFFSTFTFPEWHANNVDQDLIDRGLTTGTFVDEVWSVSPVFGGPIVQDRLWFFLTHTSGRADLLAADVFFNVDPTGFAYVPDENAPSPDETTYYEQSLNLTWQVSSKDKAKLYWSNTHTDKPHLLQGATLGTIFIAPEAALRNPIRVNVYQATWTRPQTNRVLFEAGVSHQPLRLWNFPTAEAVTTIPGILEFSPVTASRNMSGWFSGRTERGSPRKTDFARGSMSYVTGSHNLKVGMTALWQREINDSRNDGDWTNINTFGGFPIRASFFARGADISRGRTIGLYAQEQWDARPANGERRCPVR